MIVILIPVKWNISNPEREQQQWKVHGSTGFRLPTAWRRSPISVRFSAVGETVDTSPEPRGGGVQSRTAEDVGPPLRAEARRRAITGHDRDRTQ